MQVAEWNLIKSLINLPRSTKRILMISADIILIPIAWYITKALLTNQVIVSINASERIIIASLLIVTIPVLARLGLYHAIVRFMGDRAVLAVIKGASAITVCYFFTIITLTHPLLSNIITLDDEINSIHLGPVLMVFWGTCVLLLGGTRLATRHLINSHQTKKKQKIVIYGAGRTGAELLRAITSSHTNICVAFIDDNPLLQRSVIDGVRVISQYEFNKILLKHDVRQVLLAMPKLDRLGRRKIINALEPFPIQIKTVPSLSDIINGRAELTDIQDIDIEDLLGRDPIEPNMTLMENCIRNKRVLVTGAGGSIGSELCRQIIKHGPKQLLLLDSCEYALYSIEKELLTLPDNSQYTCKDQSKQHEKRVLSFLTNVQDRARLDSIFGTFQIDTVYHAAAFKHVPMVEHNIVDGIQNNVLGTLNTALAAKKSNVSTFVLISTDKAVRPTNIMGTTKRLAELILQALADEKSNAHTTFCMVRFGNVLGSSGSVVPLFRDQINNGGPVTVTHPEVIRYFMTITEASQLVIQAGAMAKGGEVFVLDMGEPVKIDALAQKMIRLMGKEVKTIEYPHGEIAIQYTGLRPGEKLYEELLIGNNSTNTYHPRIMMAEENYLSWENMNLLIQKIQSACAAEKFKTIIELLLTDITGFVPKHQPNDHIFQEMNIQQQQKPLELNDVTVLKTANSS